MYACLGVTCHLHVWQNDQGLLCATAIKWGVEQTPNKSQHTVDSGQENSPITSARIPTLNLFNYEFGTLTNELAIPAVLVVQ